jgi:hypothetical protein
MLFSYGNSSNSSDLNAPSRSNVKKTLVESMLPDTNPWVMCMTRSKQEYYINLFTHQIRYEKPFYFREYENRIIENQIHETSKELELLRRKVHIWEGKTYEELYANTNDTCFIVNPNYTHEKGDTVWYIPNYEDPLIKSTVVDVHHDKPPFYTIRYNIVSDLEQSYIEKNTTSVRLKKYP